MYLEIMNVLKCVVPVIDKFWRTVYNHGIWIPRHVADVLVAEGWIFLVAHSCVIVWNLFFTPYVHNS